MSVGIDVNNLLSIFAQRRSPDEATAEAQDLLGVPHCRTLDEVDGFWAAYQQVAGRAG